MRMKKFAIITMALALSVGGAFTSLADWQGQGDGNWRYQNGDGSWKSNTWWQDGSGKWYNFDGNGYMRKGWFQDVDGKWYFLASTGEMQTGLIIIDGKTYFLNPSGEMFLGEKNINGTTYNFGLYGTTNGQAYISNKWLGNGEKIQMPTGTGGSGGGSSSPNGGNSHDKPVTKPVTVSDQKGLTEAVNAGNKDIRIETDDALTFTTPKDKDLSGLTLTVDASKAEVVNNTTFGTIRIINIAPSTFIENGGSKNFEITAPNARVIANTEIKKLTVSGSKVKNFSIEANKPVEMLIKAMASIDIGGSDVITATVDAEGTNITSSARINVTMNKAAAIELTNSEAIEASSITVKTSETVEISSPDNVKLPVILDVKEPTLSVKGAVEAKVTEKVKNLNVEVADKSASVTIAEGSNTSNMEKVVVSNTSGDSSITDEELKNVIQKEGDVSIPEPTLPSDEDILAKVVKNIGTLINEVKSNELKDIATVSANSAVTEIKLVGKDADMTVAEAAQDVVGLVQEFANCGATEVKIGDVTFNNSELKDQSNNGQIILAVKEASKIAGKAAVNEAKGSVEVVVYYKAAKQAIKVSISPSK